MHALEGVHLIIPCMSSVSVLDNIGSVEVGSRQHDVFDF